ncbi:MAG: hypothetical protein J1F32_02850 [Erysipelotrichales bacterium]|nr:hypothetical protein [Erysipelotrichales bacterium]
MKNIFKTFILVVSCFLFGFSQKSNMSVAHAEEIVGFYNEFNDLSTTDIGYSKGNNTTFISHNYTYYASSFSYNCVNKELQFGRSSTATMNISNEDYLSMEFDLNGYVEYIKLDIGTINLNRTDAIQFKVQYSTDFGKTYSDVNGSLKTMTGNETYSLYVDKTYDAVRFKFVIANVNEIAGKNMVIQSLSITGSNLYVYSIGHLVKMIDECTCDNVRLNYQNIASEYEKLSDYEKEVFDNLLTEDGQTTYKERLDYILNLCAKEDGNSNSSVSSVLTNLSNGDANLNKEYRPFVYIIIALAIIVLGYYLVVKNKSKKSN